MWDKIINLEFKFNNIDEEIITKEAGQVKELLEKNLELSEKIYKNSKYIKKFVITSQILGFLKLLLIVVPIVLGVIYLPPLLKNVYSQYQELLGLSQKADMLDIDKLPSQVQKYLK